GSLLGRRLAFSLRRIALGVGRLARMFRRLLRRVGGGVGVGLGGGGCRRVGRGRGVLRRVLGGRRSGRGLGRGRVARVGGLFRRLLAGGGRVPEGGDRRKCRQAHGVSL